MSRNSAVARYAAILVVHGTLSAGSRAHARLRVAVSWRMTNAASLLGFSCWVVVYALT